MEFLPNGFTLSLCQGAFPLSTDSMALADFVKLPRGACVLDLGSGCGTLGLLLCACHEDCQVTGVELDSAAHAAALENMITVLAIAILFAVRKFLLNRYDMVETPDGLVEISDSDCND